MRHPIACAIAFLLLAGCSPIYTPGSEVEDDEIVTLHFIAGGIEDQTEETMIRMARREQEQESFAKTDDGLMMVSTFTVDTTASKTRASSLMADGTAYRVAAYQSGVLKGTADGVAGSSEAKLPLKPGSYDVVAYSMNTALLPNHSESLSLTTADDFLWVNKGSLTVTADNYTDITLTFVHQRCAVTMQADATVIVHDPAYASLYEEGENITHLDANYSLSTNNVTFNPATGSITAGAATAVTPLWTGLNTKVMSAEEVYFYPTSSSITVSVTFNEITFTRNAGAPTGFQAYTDMNKTISFALTLFRGTKYTLKTKFHKLCGAKMYNYGTPGAWKQFQCFNMGATDQTDPFTPSSGINGDYYQWGRGTIVAYGPTAPSPDAINGIWNENDYADNNAWQDGNKTINDPCPSTGAGLDKTGSWRVPTSAQLANLVNTSLNSQRVIGTNWTTSSTNFSTGKWFGNNLFLPTTGLRQSNTGALNFRGSYGHYWSTTIDAINKSSSYTLFMKNNSITSNTIRSYGLSLRCIAE